MPHAPDPSPDHPQKPPTIAVIPAAGRAQRMGTLPCSKEVLPVGIDAESRQVVTLIDLLIKQLQRAEIDHVSLSVAPHKTDIEPYLLARWPKLQLDSIHLESPSALHSVAAAIQVFDHTNVALGFPDIHLPVHNAFGPLLDMLDNPSEPADIVLGLFGTDHPNSADMVAHHEGTNRVKHLAIKQPTISEEYQYFWATAAWTPTFSAFLVDYVRHQDAAASQPSNESVHVGHAIIAALKAGLECRSVLLSEDNALDAGTPARYQQLLQKLNTP